MTAARCPRAPLVYVAHPVTTYGTARERKLLARVADHLAPAQVIDPAVRYRSRAHWLDDWPRLVGSISGLVVFTDVDGTIGAGCLGELTDAWRLEIPVALVDDHGAFRHVPTLRIVPHGRRTALRTAVVVGGRQFDLAAALGQPPVSP